MITVLGFALIVGSFYLAGKIGEKYDRKELKDYGKDEWYAGRSDARGLSRWISGAKSTRLWWGIWVPISIFFLGCYVLDLHA